MSVDPRRQRPSWLHLRYRQRRLRECHAASLVQPVLLTHSLNDYLAWILPTRQQGYRIAIVGILLPGTTRPSHIPIQPRRPRRRRLLHLPGQLRPRLHRPGTLRTGDRAEHQQRRPCEQLAKHQGPGIPRHRLDQHWIDDSERRTYLVCLQSVN